MDGNQAQGALDVVGIGHAIVDVIAEGDEAFLAANGIEKGVMTLIDTARATELYGRMGTAIESSGGSCANTMAGLASLGGKGAFIGRVRDDALGEIFRHDIRAIGVGYDVPFAVQGPPTARCLIVVTPDGQRTMSTYLGAATEIGPEDVDTALAARAKVLYLEGYLWDGAGAKAAMRKAIAATHAAGGKVALTLSDPFCVDRHRAEFRALVEGEVDILFANEAEIGSLYETGFDDAAAAVRHHCAIAALTRSEKGSVVVAGGETHKVGAEPVARAVDTTGAGDLYAAGFLYGLTQGRDLVTCARLGGIAAAEIIGHVGARPAVPLAPLARGVMG